MTVQEIIHTLHKLKPEELEEVRQYLANLQMGLVPPLIDRLEEGEQYQDDLQMGIIRQIKRSPEELEQRVKQLHAALENFWEGCSEEEIEQIIADMNEEYISDKPDPLAWLDELPEDER